MNNLILEQYKASENAISTIDIDTVNLLDSVIQINENLLHDMDMIKDKKVQSHLIGFTFLISTLLKKVKESVNPASIDHLSNFVFMSNRVFDIMSSADIEKVFHLHNENLHNEN